jgi:CBS domain-containing protein
VVPVVDAEGGLLGMLAERYCLKILVDVALDGWPRGRVSGHMSSSSESVRPGVCLYDVAHLFLTRAFRKLLVID